MRYDVIIIGGGQAGAMLAITLRQQKYSGSILLINDENYLPYQRPPLSKNFLTHSISIESLYFKSSDYYKKNSIDILLNSPVTSIKRDNKSVEVKNGAEFLYKKLVIATGSKLNKLDFDNNTEGTYYLKNINDSKQIKSLLDFQQKIVVIGAGYIGLEIAAAARKKDHEVTVLEADQRVMSRSVCQKTSNFFEAIHQREGVNFLFNTQIKNIQESENKKRISLNDGKAIDADAIIIGIGVRPRTGLAVAAGLNCKDGITVNELCQTSDENIFAIGDCANYPNAIFDLRLRLESVQNAIDHAKIAASKINETGPPDHEIPWFWPDFPL